METDELQTFVSRASATLNPRTRKGWKLRGCSKRKDLAFARSFWLMPFGFWR